MLFVLVFERAGPSRAAAGPAVALLGVADGQLGVDGRREVDPTAEAERAGALAQHHGDEAEVVGDDDVVGGQSPDDGVVGGVGTDADRERLHTGPLGVSGEVLRLVPHQDDRDAVGAGDRDRLARHRAGVGVDEDDGHVAASAGALRCILPPPARWSTPSACSIVPHWSAAREAIAVAGVPTEGGGGRGRPWCGTAALVDRPHVVWAALLFGGLLAGRRGRRDRTHAGVDPHGLVVDPRGARGGAGTSSVAVGRPRVSRFCWPRA